MLLNSITVNVSTTSSVYILLYNDKDVYDSFRLLVFSHLHACKYKILNFHVIIMKICIASISSPKIYSTFLVNYQHSLQNILGKIYMQSPSSYEYA